MIFLIFLAYLGMFLIAGFLVALQVLTRPEPDWREINHALGLCRKRRLGYRCHGRPGECD
jgi:hypothetical protein